MFNGEKGYTIFVYVPPEAGPEATERIFEAVADVVHSAEPDRGYWDPFVVVHAGDYLGVDDDPQDWPISVANPKRARVS